MDKTLIRYLESAAIPNFFNLAPTTLQYSGPTPLKRQVLLFQFQGRLCTGYHLSIIHDKIANYMKIRLFGDGRIIMYSFNNPNCYPSFQFIYNLSSLPTTTQLNVHPKSVSVPIQTQYPKVIHSARFQLDSQRSIATRRVKP